MTGPGEEPGRPAARRVLVIVAARIGDTLLTTPAIEALRQAHPGARITVMAHPKRMQLLQHVPGIDQLADITKHRARWRGWFSRKPYDIAVVYGNDRELVRYALRISRRVTVFEQAGLPDAPNLVRVPRPRSGAAMHAVRERALLAEAAGAQAVGGRLQYVVAPQEGAAARAWLADRTGPEARPLVALQVASFPTKSHRDWPLESFAELIARLLDAYPGAHFVVLGDGAAREKARALVERFGARVAVSAGTTTLRQSAALIACADLYIGVDTGPTHIAGAIGVPMVALYHNAYPGRYLAPLEHAHCIVIEHPLTGKSSSIEESMASISVDEVFQAARRLLDGRQETSPRCGR